MGSFISQVGFHSVIQLTKLFIYEVRFLDYLLKATTVPLITWKEMTETGCFKR